MKHIALLLPAMRIGGAEKICLNFLDDLLSEYKVTMLLTKKEGDLIALVPDCVEILEDRLLSFHEVVSEDIRHIRIRYLMKDLLYYLRIKRGKDSEKNYRYLISRTPARKESYDYAISYVANVSTQVFCLADRVNAKKKIAWMHGETTELKDTALFAECYRKFDKVYTVSEVTRDHFANRFPGCGDKTEVYYNPIRKDVILKRSEEKITYSFGSGVTNIVTVGRISPEKGMDMIPEIMGRLINRGLAVHWYIIGDGSLFDQIRDTVEQMGLGHYITMTGNQLNPYPFMKKCDIYVQPSYEEGYSTTICEAGILGKAIIGTTTSGGIREQIDDGVDGILAEPTPDDLANKIAELIVDTQKRSNMERKILQKDFSNAKEFLKLKAYLEDEENAD